MYLKICHTNDLFFIRCKNHSYRADWRFGKLQDHLSIFQFKILAPVLEHSMKAILMHFFNVLKKTENQQIHWRWINVKTTLIINVYRCYFNVDIWLKIKVELTHIFRRQRWSNINRITSIQRLKSNVVSMLIFGWKRKLKQSMFTDVFLSALIIFAGMTLTEQWVNNKIELCFQAYIYISFIKK